VDDQVNPYAPPQADGEPSATSDGDETSWLDASGGARFLNMIIDGVGRGIFAYVLTFMLAMAGIRMDGMTGILFGLCSMIVYYLGFETLLGRTPGKLITGTRVVKDDGSPLTLVDVLKRTLSRFVPFEPFSFLGDSRGWHDRWSHTRVISVRR
jgi:uncharacterized RDD family membrane protein YckC